MTTTTPPDADVKQDAISGDELALAALLRAVGARREPDAVVKEQIRGPVELEWRRAARRHRPRALARRVLPFALAATIVASVAGLYLLAPLGSPNPLVQVASFEHGQGSYTVRNVVATSSGAIMDGALVTTRDDGLVALRLTDRTSLRFDHGTHATLYTNNSIWLHRGGIYVDSPGRLSGVSVTTSFGEIVDVGTQFEVRLRDDGLTVALREGEVRVGLPDGPVTGRASAGIGDVIDVDRSLDVTKRTIGTADPRWSWTMAAAPDFVLEAASVLELLEWTQRETGKRLVFETPATKLAASVTRMSGGATSVSPTVINEALVEILQTTEFEVDLTATTIGVRQRR